MSRRSTRKTAISVILFRFYLVAFLLSSPLIWMFWGGYHEGQIVFGTGRVATHWDIIISHAGVPFSIFVAATILWFTLWILLRIACWYLFAGDSSNAAWRKAGGDPFFDVLQGFNCDPPVVRAAIGIPPDTDVCRFCGASLRSIFGNCNFGNRCDACGEFNDCGHVPLRYCRTLTSDMCSTASSSPF